MENLPNTQRRITTLILCVIGTLCILAATIGATFGQTTTSAFGNSGSPIDIVSDSLSISENRKKAVFKGRVIAKQEGSTLKSQILEVFYANRKNPTSGQNEQAVKTIIAKGKVILIMPDQTVTGDWGRYDLASEIIHMTGNVVVKKPDTTLTGSEFVADLRSGLSKVVSKGEDRVRIKMKAGGAE